LETPFSEAVTVTLWAVAVAGAEAVNVAEDEPAATVTEAGTPTAALVEESETVIAAAADLERVTVQVVLPPGASDETAQPSEDNVAGVAGADTVMPVVLETPFSDAVRVAAVSTVTVPAVSVNTAEDEPAATVTEAGTVTAALLDESETGIAAAAALDSVTVQVVLAPEASEEAAQPSEASVAGVAGATTVMPVVWETPFSEAVRVAAVSTVTVPAVAVNVAEDAPAATVTEAGTPTAVLFEESATAAAEEAAALSVTVQVEAAPELTLAGEHATELNAAAEPGAAVTPPPVAVAATVPPAGEAPRALPTPIAADVAPGARLTDTVATTPLPITVELTPESRHRYPAAPPAQVTDLPAPAPAGPADTTRLDTLDAG
jgi:hypothetical protein